MATDNTYAEFLDLRRLPIPFSSYRLIGSWINSVLFTLEVVLIFHWQFRTSESTARHRPRWHNLGVVALFVVDAISTCSIFVLTYVSLLESSPHTKASLNMFTNSLVLTIFTTYATASMEQLFLCHLYYALSQRRSIVAFLVLCVFVHLGFSYASMGLIIGTRAAPTRGAPLWTTKVGAISCAVTDILIAGTLLHTFLRLEKTSVVRLSTQSLLRHLMLLISTSGIIVAFTTLIAMLLFLKNNHAYSLFLFCQGRVYALTILANFLVGNTSARQTDTNTLTLPPSVINSNVVFRSNAEGTTTTVHIDNQERRVNRRLDPGDDVDMDTLSFTPSKAAPSSVE
ncbi:hypothetical protein C8F01DRAFT_1255389 [Mycena amicta]|nr:hypothetical protein C8F01DRAFT_1255389 [Mycena amicta]